MDIDGPPFSPSPRDVPPPAVLAYVGDAVYELYVRRHVAQTAGPMPVRRLHRRVVALVRAEAQAEALRRIEPRLTDEERNVARRGRNAAGGTAPGRPAGVRQGATAFEALVGYLYLTGRRRRLEELIGPVVRQERGEQAGAGVEAGGTRGAPGGSSEGPRS